MSAACLRFSFCGCATQIYYLLCNRSRHRSEHHSSTFRGTIQSANVAILLQQMPQLLWFLQTQVCTVNCPCLSTASMACRRPNALAYHVGRNTADVYDASALIRSLKLLQLLSLQCSLVVIDNVGGLRLLMLIHGLRCRQASPGRDLQPEASAEAPVLLNSLACAARAICHAACFAFLSFAASMVDHDLAKQQQQISNTYISSQDGRCRCRRLWRRRRCWLRLRATHARKWSTCSGCGAFAGQVF